MKVKPNEVGLPLGLEVGYEGGGRRGPRRSKYGVGEGC